ncbi:conserved hypothetical protein [Frankia canadensis]|uniref:Uncharacterized protein n=1 Tax=Frankia canadensis TaxID=1836972 RepID=A0A2I2KQP4_9ACTN|nr:hypothetical protein [Frankia canadensis]SNQ47991.1 conserved hypothetical protein [Frankia canadensis]SOU55281.1 conserved hypothetical protein [Frankia canadensis]
MTDDLRRSCPSWCREPAGHLHPQSGGPGDCHAAEIATVRLGEIPGLRGATPPIHVKIEQYVTDATAYPPVISLDFGGAGEPSGSDFLTPEEAYALAAALRQAVITLRTAGCSRGGQQVPPSAGVVPGRQAEPGR